MTQAFNLAQFANTLNSSGQTSNSGLQNSSVTVTAGTGMSGGGPVALGSSVTLTNAGVTSLTAGSGISLSGSTGAITVSASGGVTAGNGIGVSGSTVSVACPTFNTVGSYVLAGSSSGNTSQITSGSNYSAGTGTLAIQSYCGLQSGGNNNPGAIMNGTTSNNLSGTWKWMASSSNGDSYNGRVGLACRVA